MKMTGRRRIFTDEKRIDAENIVPVLRKAYGQHKENIRQITYLLEYEAGIHPGIRDREKKIRPDINYKVVDNVAHYVTRFHVGYFWGTPAMYIQRGDNEIHETPHEIEDAGIGGLNEMLRNGEDISYKRQHIAKFVEKTGIGHSMVDIMTADEFGDDPLIDKNGHYIGSLCHVYSLDSRYTFCVYYNGVNQPMVLGVTYVKKQNGRLHFTCYTDEYIFEIENWEVTNVQGDGMRITPNLLGMIPIVEWNRDTDITGCFEHCLSDMDSLDVDVSDFTNNSTQRTQDIWWGHNIELPEDTDGNPKEPKSGEWVLTYTPQGLNDRGSDAKIAPLANTYDSASALSQMYRRFNHILQKCYVPIQNESSGGGSTGTAMDMSAGWSAAELDALEEQNVIEYAVRRELKLILKAITFVPESVLPMDNPIRQVHYTDIDVHFSRRRNYDLSVKANAFATLVGRGVNGRHALKVTEMFEDNEQVWNDSKEFILAYQNKVCFDHTGETTTTTETDNEEISEDHFILQDNSMQSSNSPIIGGFLK